MPNSDSTFFKLGHKIFRFRKAIIFFWGILFSACIPFIALTDSPFKDTGFIAEGSISDRTEQFLNKKLGYAHNEFMILYHSKHLIASDPLYLKQIKKSLEGLKCVKYTELYK